MAKICVVRGWRSALNIHERRLPVPPASVGELLESISGPDDRVWPWEQWPPMVLDRGLEIGSAGGHAIIRYEVSEYAPGRRVEFTFRPMAMLRVFRGRHYFEVLADAGESIIRHTIDVRMDFRTWLVWKMLIEPIHDVVIEDLFDKVERNTGLQQPRQSNKTLYVRFALWLHSRRR